MQQPTDLVDKHLKSYVHTYTERDVILYALGVGCSMPADAKWLNEFDATHQALPTFLVIPAHPVLYTIPFDQYIPGCDRAKGLHGEQYLEVLQPRLATQGKLVTRPQVIDLQDKGGKAVAVVRTTTINDATGEPVAVNEFTSVLMGTQPFAGLAQPAPRSAAATARNDLAARPPDAVEELPTTSSQAALYRLSGDYNPLHIDGGVAAAVGFPRPILHGLCTMGMSARAVLRRFAGDDAAALASIKVRFARHVFPGETLVVSMWVADGQPDTVVFETRVKERAGVVAVSNAAVKLRGGALRLKGAPARL